MEQPCLKSVLNQTMPHEQQKPETTCQDWKGALPSCAPLANPYVPFQNANPKRYKAEKGLIRGTLFPGLDLPYLGMVNEKEKGSDGLAELQALSFALTELGLYLDTHKDDLEAGELFKAYSELYQKGVSSYQKAHGPLYQVFAAPDGRYKWTEGPWPWEYSANQED